MDRIRLTEQAVVNIRAARTANLVKNKSGYIVQVSNKKGDSIFVLDKFDRPVIYGSKDAAKKAIKRHNPNADVFLKAQI